MEQNGTGISDVPTLTFGQKAVGITFNPGGMPEVYEIKQLCADVIDKLDGYRNGALLQDNGEKAAMFDTAIREIQSAQMWAVKAATWQY
jgi:hypothetical protein